MDWLLLQLADSSFPTGGFAHSSGLEAAFQQGEVQNLADLEKFLLDALWQLGHGALPLASAAHQNPERLAELDRLCDVFLSSPVANRASRVQGRTFLSTCLRSLATEDLAQLACSVSEGRLRQHHAPLFGVVLRVLNVDREPMQRLLLHSTLRGLLSAAIRLGVLGPYQAQHLQRQFARKLEEVLAACGPLKETELAQTAPLLDLFQSTHDRLYSRLFQS